MKSTLKFRGLAFLLILVFATGTAFAQIPNGYYNSAAGLDGAQLKTALFNIIKNPTFWQGKYFNARSFFEENDRTPDGYIWDMYSDTKSTNWNGNIFNREHNMPKSWFGVASGNEDAYSIGCDYQNLYPSEKTANGKKSNYPLGEVNNSPSFDNGVVKVGKSRIAIGGYNGNVFEPSDEYKGDFARNYMYMVTCYEDYAPKWTTSNGMTMLHNDTYPVFTQYAIDLLMTWHRNDPVSQKEIDRNNAVYDYQNNRNPFIDHPEYAEYIWGEQSQTPELNTDNFSAKYYSDRNELEITLNNPDNASFEIYSISGMKMIWGVISDNNTISCAKLPRGMYVISVYAKNQNLKNQNKKYTAKFVMYNFER
ncbi:MAG: endonuclease [Prevotellaceae bacterium]|jgi:endonuclease I|nr:endonuclease [Prevotellaceae bacterium]